MLQNQMSQNLQLDLCGAGHRIYKSSCKACIALQKHWYDYLYRSGFEDIEKGLRLVGPTEEIAQRTHAMTENTFQAKRDYYQWAQECLSNCSFDSQIDRIIWQYHSEGYSRREIAPILGYKDQSTITRRVHKIESMLKCR